MFTSTRFLTEQLGVDTDVAAFFVDRRVPPDNVYWRDRKLYVASGTGYLFIPIIYDILLRVGVDKAILLEEDHVCRMEWVLDSAGKVEFENLSGVGHILTCVKLMEPVVRNEWLWNGLQEYFIIRNGEPTRWLGRAIHPLNRADTFLFSLCDLPMNELLTQAFIPYWYALIAAFLLMDDIVDWDIDKQQGEENAIRFLGEGSEAVRKAIEMLRGDFETLSNINPALGAYFGASLQKQIKKLSNLWR